MRYRIFFAITLISAIFACQDHKKDIGLSEKISIDPTNTQNIKRSQIFSLNRIIQLENHPEAAIGQTQSGFDLVPGKKFILVSSSNVSLYDYSGNFQYNISKMGRGPGEYITNSEILLCKNKFRMLDRTQKKIINFELDGAFLNEYPLVTFAQSFICQNDYTIIYIGNAPNEFNKRLFLYDNEFVMLDSYFSIGKNHEQYLNVFDKTNFFVFLDSLRFLNAFDYNIYNVDIINNSFDIEPRYYLEFGEYETPESYFNKEFSNIKEFITTLEKSNYAFYIQGFIETEDNIYFSFSYSELNNRYLAIYSKQSKNAIVVDKIIDDIIFDGLKFCSVFDEFLSYYYSNNQIYFVMDAYNFVNNMRDLKGTMSEKEWEKYKIKNVEIIKLYDETDKFDNPLIFIFDLKPFII